MIRFKTGLASLMAVAALAACANDNAGRVKINGDKDKAKVTDASFKMEDMSGGETYDSIVDRRAEKGNALLLKVIAEYKEAYPALENLSLEEYHCNISTDINIMDYLPTDSSMTSLKEKHEEKIYAYLIKAGKITKKDLELFTKVDPAANDKKKQSDAVKKQNLVISFTDVKNYETDLSYNCLAPASEDKPDTVELVLDFKISGEATKSKFKGKNLLYLNEEAVISNFKLTKRNKDENGDEANEELVIVADGEVKEEPKVEKTFQVEKLSYLQSKEAK